MQYVLIHNQQVLNGPRVWNYRSFESTLASDLGQTVQLPIQKTDDLPYIIDTETEIRPIQWTENPPHNPKIEILHGPFWDFTDPNWAIGSYVVQSMEVEAVKNMLKAQVADTRWRAETGGTTVTIQSTEIHVKTDRVERNIYLQALQLGAANNTWKFNNIWLTLSLTDLQTLVTAIMTHIQTAFDWESSKVTAIDAATTLAELDAVDLTYV